MGRWIMAGAPLVVGIAVGAVTAAPAAGQRSPVDSLAWLAGCWELRGGPFLVEEHWMAPRGGTMVGMSRTVREGATIAHEALLLFLREGRLVYRAVPSGQSTTDFTAVAVEEGRAVFENPEHDFPRRIIYARRGDSLHARIEGEAGDGGRASDFRYARVACPGPGPGGPGGPGRPGGPVGPAGPAGPGTEG